ncbi:MAG: beta-eliminating lyase-related protein, partial [Clostridia bacterium]|nr:beta-eliminating lyase-related protein [Clostridia bacterium]
GHKVLALPSKDGKLDAAAAEACVKAHYADENAEHIVQPGMVYISQPTELGTLYSREELSALHTVCRAHGLKLYLDGARLGCALAAGGPPLAFLAAHTDAFTIGGTKMGALLGEALVIGDEALGRDFRYIMKQRGALLAKGRLIGLQFEALFSGGLYVELARHAVGCAQTLAEGLRARGYAFLTDSRTNQIFPILPRGLIRRLRQSFAFAFWQGVDGERDAIRLCCSWATPPEQIGAFLAALDEYASVQATGTSLPETMKR